MEIVEEIHAPIDAPTLAADEHPGWCSADHCRRHDFDGGGAVVAHASAPLRVPLFDAVLELQLWHTCRYGEPIEEDFAAPDVGEVVSIRRMSHSGPSADDRHDVLTLYGARVLSKGLASLLAQYDRATPLTR